MQSLILKKLLTTGDGWQSLFKQPTRHTCERGCVGTSNDGAQSPQGPSMTVIRAIFFQPMTLVVHKVAKATGLAIKGIREKGKITGRQG